MENIIIKLFNYSIDYTELDEITGAEKNRLERGTAAGINYIDTMKRIFQWHNNDVVNKITLEEYSDPYRSESFGLMVNSIITKTDASEDEIDTGEG